MKFSIVYFWLGCLVGGLILGLGFGRISSTQKLEPINDTDIVLAEESTSVVATESATVDELVTILFTGDVMLGRSVNERIIINSNTSWPFVHVHDALRSADITYINLESPLVTDCPRTDKGMKFCGDVGNVAGLVDVGVDVASLANNHSTNYGADGLNETINILTNNGIGVVGINAHSTIVRKGNKYNFLSYNDAGRFAGIAQADITNMTNQIKSIKESGGLVVVGFHWGEEYKTQPNSRQISLAHSAIDAGADLIIGSHPHWVQTNELYKGRPIYYSLGNFVFDQEWSAETKKGLAVRFTYRGELLEHTEELPVYIERYGQPHWR